MKFAHLGDCHLGGWRQPELLALNQRSFSIAIDRCIKEKVEFVLIAGDLFDSAYPPIDVIKEAFMEFRRLKEANIPVFLIAGSHDYSVSGKTFLEVLEKAGFAKNVYAFDERGDSIYLHPTIFKNVAIYGFPGRKSGLEVEDIKRIKLHDAPGLFKILMLHTTLRDAVGTLPIPAVSHETLPKVDYLALSHLHIVYKKGNRVYSGPTFPNNSLELEELQGGTFYFVDTNGKIDRQDIKLHDVVIIDLEIADGLTATELILNRIRDESLENKIVIIRLHGFLQNGKTTDIRFNEIDDVIRKKGAYVLLKNMSKLRVKETELRIDTQPESLEEVIIARFKQENVNVLNNFIESLIPAFQVEKKEDEKSQTYEDRLYDEIKKVLEL